MFARTIMSNLKSHTKNKFPYLAYSYIEFLILNF